MPSLRVTDVLICLVLGLTTTLEAQTTPVSQPPLEIQGRQGEHYWVVETAPNGSRRGGWINAQVPLDRIDRSALQPIPALPATPLSATRGAQEDASLNERVVRIEQALSAGPDGGLNVTPPPVASVQSSPPRQAGRPQAMQPRFSSDEREIGKGTVELTALGSLSGVSVDGETASFVTLNTFVGVFATSMVEVGASSTVMKIGDLNTSGGLMGHVFFNFPNDSVIVPFVGAGLGTTFGNGDVIGHPLTLDISGGFRVMMPGRGGALVIRPFYQRANVSSEFIDIDLNTWGVAIGASLLF